MWYKFFPKKECENPSPPQEVKKKKVRSIYTVYICIRLFSTNENSSPPLPSFTYIQFIPLYMMFSKVKKSVFLYCEERNIKVFCI